MISWPEIQPLLQQMDSPMLSVYLDVDPSKAENQGGRRAYRIWLENALREFADKVPRREKAAFHHQATRVQKWMDTYANGKGIAIFAAPDHWQLIHLPESPVNSIAWGRPAVGPLLCQLYTHRPYGVILVDHVRVRCFMVTPMTQGHPVQEVMDFVLPLDTSDWRHKDVVPPGTPEGTITSGVAGSNLDAFQARIDAHVRRFLLQVAEWTPALVQKYGAEGLVLGGPPEPVAKFRALLPAEARAELLDTLPIPLESSASQMRELTVPVVQQRRIERDRETVAALLDRAQADGPAVLGLEPTLRYLQRGQVQRLIAKSGCEAEVRRCPNCGFATSYAETNTCPLCGHDTETAPLSTVLPVLALAKDSEIVIVQAEAAAALAPFEGIGALLRFS